MITMPWHRRRTEDVDVHERDTAARRPAVPEEEYAAALVASITYREKARRLGRDYGRASATIHALRADNALLREELDVRDHDAEIRERQVEEASRRASDAEQRLADLAGGGGAVVGTAAPGDTTLADNIVDAVEQLARYLAAVAMPDVEWREDRAAFKDTYRAYAWAVASVGWRPPVVLAAPDRVATVARVLTDHELLADDTCRCGWGDWPAAPSWTKREPAAVWHAEHQAEQLVGLGVLG